MALAVGTRLGSCEVLGRVGAGGMGEVFRARDHRLGREVALKVLPDGVAGQPLRRARFEREARLLASLNHPHIAAIYELLETDGNAPVLVLELVEGEALDARILRGPLPLRDALILARQIAEALEAAHDKGILHRDLKPSNVKLTLDGKAKLLDFGLAKALEDRDGELSVGTTDSSLETLASPPQNTEAGTLLGTAPYMSPEQARGERVDKRTDVWAFGCLLFEMLSGRRAFGGTTRREVIQTLTEREPDWSTLPTETPATVLALLRRCLRKEKGERLRDVADARIELKEAFEALTSGLPRSAGTPVRGTGRAKDWTSHRAWPWILGGLSASVAVGFGYWIQSQSTASLQAARLTFSPPNEVELLSNVSSQQHMALSPDGRRVAFVGRSNRGLSIYLREAGTIDARLVSDGAVEPFFSPDGSWLAFAQGSRLMKVPLDGRSPEAICDLPGNARPRGLAGLMRGASWGSDGTIVFAPDPNLGLWIVPAEGGTARPLTSPRAHERFHRWPQVLPGGDQALFTIGTPSLSARDARIGLVSLRTGEYRTILEGTGYARFHTTGHILYLKLGAVLAVPFDVSRGAVTGPPVKVLDDVQMSPGGHFYADLDVSKTGALAYVPGAERIVERFLFWVDRDGRAAPLTSTRRHWMDPRLSPDGRQLAVSVGSDLENTDIWLTDLGRDTWSRITTAGWNHSPAWSGDGSRLAFATGAASGSQVMATPKDASRPPELMADGGVGAYKLDEWSPDGRILFSRQNPGRMWDIGLQSASTQDDPSYLAARPYSECCAAIAPGGRWMAYVSYETNNYEVYVQPFPGPGQKHRVSTQGGIQPRWSRDGRELFYRTEGERPKIMAVAVETRSGLAFGRPQPLFDDLFTMGLPYSRANYDVSPDGRFVFVEKPPETPAPRQIVLIPDFSRELKQKLRAAGR